jgi:hypothetical protein
MKSLRSGKLAKIYHNYVSGVGEHGLILNILIFDSKIRDKGDGWRRRIQL